MNFNKYKQYCFNLLFISIICFSLYIIFLIVLYNLKLHNNNNTTERFETKPDSLDEPEDSGKCEKPGDLVNYCINYNSCCTNITETNKCICNHPAIKTCRDKFLACNKLLM